MQNHKESMTQYFYTDAFLYIYGPLRSTPAICTVHVYISITTMMQGLLLLDAIIIVKYLFIFYMKNPTAVQEDFWKVNDILREHVKFFVLQGTHASE